MIVLGLLTVALVAYAFLPALGSVSAVALNYSLTDEVGGSSLFGAQPCRRRPARIWRCFVADSENSGGATYRVKREGVRCWRARKVIAGEEVPLQGRGSGCVGLRHQLRLLARLLPR